MTGSKTPPRAAGAHRGTGPHPDALHAPGSPGLAGGKGQPRSPRKANGEPRKAPRSPAQQTEGDTRDTWSAPAAVDAATAPPPVSIDGTEVDRVESAVRVLRRFRAVFNAVKSHFQQVEKQAGIGGAQLWALSLVEAQPGIGVGALARQMDVHQTTASNLVRSLVEQGLVASQRSGADRRATELRATRAAARVLSRAPGPFAGVLPDALNQLDSPTLKRLDEDLRQLLHLLSTDRKAERIPLAEL